MPMTAREFVASRDDCFFLKGKGLANYDLEVIPTNNIAIDHLVLGIGGVPCGRITEVFSDASVGKTTLMLHLIASAQSMGLSVLFVDAEHAYSPDYAESLGVDNEALVVSQPNNGEEALQLVREAALSGAFRLIVVDSVAALTPQAELDGEVGDAHVGLHARLMGQSMRMLVKAVSANGVALVFTNQERSSFGTGFQSNVTTGGKALKFFASVRLDLTNMGQLKSGEERTGHQVRVVAVKNKLYPPFRKATVDFLYGIGFDAAGALLDLAEKHTDLVSHKGAAWKIEGESYHGRANAAAALREGPDLTARVEAEVLKALEGEVIETAAPDSVEGELPTVEDLTGAS